MGCLTTPFVRMNWSCQAQGGLLRNMILVCDCILGIAGSSRGGHLATLISGKADHMYRQRPHVPGTTAHELGLAVVVFHPHGPSAAKKLIFFLKSFFEISLGICLEIDPVFTYLSSG